MAAQKVDPVRMSPVNAGNADGSSASGPRRVVPDIEVGVFSRFALSADGTSAFPAVDCLMLTRVAAG